jgi:2-octaprenyl-6-methoxyphenol hydroxylase
MNPAEFDVLITGAGPAGCAAALLLAAHAPNPARIALRGVFEDANAEPGPATRTLALNQGSCALLESLGLTDVPGADIHTVHVSQKGRLGRTLIEHTAMQAPRLGKVAAYGDLLARLRAAVLRSGVSVQALAAAGISAAEPAGAAHAMHIVSDGQRPQQLARQYNQHAVLAVARASCPRARWAFERFTREGPLALLPHPAADGLYSVVWCCPPALAQARHDAPAAEFNAQLQAQFGERLGRLELVSQRQIAPLALSLGPQWTGGRRVIIGNAAQTLHPVAGQGLNLALRDAAQLAQALRPWLHRPGADPAPFLSSFQRARQADRWLTAGITDLLPRLFTTANPLIEHACGLGLLTLDVAASLRAPLSRHLLQGWRA